MGPEHQAGLDFTLHRPQAFGAVGIHALEWQRRAVALAEQEGAFGAVLVAVFKHPVDGAHHGFGGAEVLAQGVSAGLHTQPCLQVGVDIGAPEAVNGLFRITDHQQAGVRAVRFHVIDPVEDAVLHRVGVLEFVNQRHRELPADGGRQLVAPGAVQGVVQAGEQVIKAHFRALLFLRLQPAGNPVAGVAQDVRLGAGLVLAEFHQGFNGVEGRVMGAGLVPFQDVIQAFGGLVLVTGGAVQFLRQQFVGFNPGQQVVPDLEHGVLAATVKTLAFVQVVQQVGDFLLPLGPGVRFQFIGPCLPFADHLVDGLVYVLWRFAQGVRIVDQVAHRFAQVGGGFPVAEGFVHQGRWQRVHKGAPVIPGHVFQQFALVGGQGEFEQTATVEGVFAEHAVTPAVDGGHRGFVHPFGGQ